MSDPRRIDEIIAEELAPFIISKQAPVPTVTVDDLQRVVRDLRDAKRIVVCHNSKVDIITAAVAEEGLDGMVEVLGTRFLEPHQAYIAKPLQSGYRIQSEALPGFEFPGPPAAFYDTRQYLNEFDDGGPFSG